ncbi:MAG: 2-hydroxyacid dehydrogenase [Oscillospiraceae bacterium]|nr:2-hydroxyacid dehydrogenase [Oscillospiraceae bacterium]
MKIAFYDTKPYDKIWFEPLAEEYGYTLRFFEYRLGADTAALAKGYDAVCAFVNDVVDKEVIDILYESGIRLIALRSAGYNHVDVKAAFEKIHVVRVPSYSPAAVAEHAAALLLTLNRKTHRAYLRTRDNNFNINGLMGFDLNGKTAGIIGTGKIGKVFADICKGFGMKVLAYDAFPDAGAGIEYVELDTLLESADVVSLHCPLTPDTRHIINKEALRRMKETALLINTSRGALVDTGALIDALKNKRIGGAGLDVYEEEEEYFFEDLSSEILLDDDLARLLSFPNVLVTSHQGFFTREAMQAIAMVTMENIYAFGQGKLLDNEICYRCESDCGKKAGQKEKCF